MKIDTMNIMTNNMNTNNSFKSENTKSSNGFMKIFNESSNEGILNKRLLDDNESEDYEKILMKLIEMMIKNNNEINNIEDLVDKLKNHEGLLSKTSENVVNEIISDISIDEYFPVNDVKIQGIINISESSKNKNGFEEIIILLDELKYRMSFKDNKDKFKNDFMINNYLKNLSIENGTDKTFEEDFIKIDTEISKALNNYCKENICLKVEDKIKNSNDKEISILQEIAKDDNNNFIINENKYRTVGGLDISSRKTNAPTEVKSSNFSQDMIESINYLKKNNLQELKVKLNPKELGEISIKLIKSEKETKLSILVAKDEVYSLVNKNLQDISKHLESLDIKVSEISVDVKSDNQNSFSDNLNKDFKEQKEKRKNNHKEDIEKIEIENISLANEDNINLLA